MEHRPTEHQPGDHVTLENPPRAETNWQRDLRQQIEAAIAERPDHVCADGRHAFWITGPMISVRPYCQCRQVLLPKYAPVYFEPTSAPIGFDVGGMVHLPTYRTRIVERPAPDWRDRIRWGVYLAAGVGCAFGFAIGWLGGR